MVNILANMTTTPPTRITASIPAEAGTAGGNVKYCHLCLKSFEDMAGLHKHIDNDHTLRHPTKNTMDYLCAKEDSSSRRSGQ